MVTLDINGKATRVDAEPATSNYVRSQVEGAAGDALSAAFDGAITLADSLVEQTDCHGYAPTRIAEMPTADVCIMPSAEKRTGVGEPAVPPVAPAVANAIAAAMDRRARRLPINVQEEVQ